MPDCGYNYASGNPEVKGLANDYSGGWTGRGELIVIPFEGECGHRWSLCIGFHKGEVMIFERDDREVR